MKINQNRKKILITAGDPNGIGCEVILNTVNSNLYPEILVVGSYRAFEFYATKFGSKIPLNRVVNLDSDLDPHGLNILDIPFQSDIEPGVLSKDAGLVSLKTLDKAIELIQMGFSKTLVTAPLNKEAVIASYPAFTGHTEYLANAFDVPKVTMALVSDRIKVAVVTTHIALSDVSQALSTEKVLGTIIHCNGFFKSIHQSDYHIAVTALNPHGGEGGHIGNEEAEIISPAIDAAKQMGIPVTGPHSADTIYCSVDVDNDEKKYDLFIAMYHDQGLIPFKMLSFGKGVNITLGLPFFRVSVDHGTAFDIAGQGKAHTGSMNQALYWASRFSSL